MSRASVLKAYKPYWDFILEMFPELAACSLAYIDDAGEFFNPEYLIIGIIDPKACIHNTLQDLALVEIISQLGPVAQIAPLWSLAHELGHAYDYLTAPDKAAWILLGNTHVERIKSIVRNKQLTLDDAAKAEFKVQVDRAYRTLPQERVADDFANYITELWLEAHNV